jgi:hypothetical protein
LKAQFCASHFCHIESRQADVAQLVEQPIRNRQVSGSSPLVGSILKIDIKFPFVGVIGDRSGSEPAPDQLD